MGEEKSVRLWPIFAVFWALLFIALSVSLFLGLTSTYVWYTEKTSHSNYLVILYVSLLMFASLSVFNALQTKQGREKTSSSESQDNRKTLSRRGKGLWLASIPLLVMIGLNLVVSAFGLVTLGSYLMPNYEVNTILMIFSGSSTKISMGLLVAFIFKMGLVRRRMTQNGISM